MIQIEYHPTLHKKRIKWIFESRRFDYLQEFNLRHGICCCLRFFWKVNLIELFFQHLKNLVWQLLGHFCRLHWWIWVFVCHLRLFLQCRKDRRMKHRFLGFSLLLGYYKWWYYCINHFMKGGFVYLYRTFCDF